MKLMICNTQVCSTSKKYLKNYIFEEKNWYFGTNLGKMWGTLNEYVRNALGKCGKRFGKCLEFFFVENLKDGSGEFA